MISKTIYNEKRKRRKISNLIIKHCNILIENKPIINNNDLLDPQPIYKPDNNISDPPPYDSLRLVPHSTPHQNRKIIILIIYRHTYIRFSPTILVNIFVYYSLFCK